MNQIAERNSARLEFVADKLVNPESRRKSNETRHHVVLARLNVVEDATRELLDDFLELSPADTEEPLTLAGWRRLQKSIQRQLKAAGYVPPK